MGLVVTEQQGRVALLKLSRGVTNALSAELVADLSKALDVVAQDPALQALILTSASAKFFSIGFDIPGLFAVDREEFAVFYRAINQLCLDLYTLPKPTVAAIGGHATAGGCILALCCDYRYISEGRKLMGLNEVKLGVPVPYLADCIVRQLVGARHAREIMEGGEFYAPAELLCLGLVDKVLPPDQVLPGSVEQAQRLGSMPAAAYAMIKQNRVGPVAAEVAARAQEQADRFVELWYSDEVRLRLEQAMVKF